MASEYRQRQENLRSHGKYVMTIKNHRQFMKNQSKTVKEQIAHFLDIDLTQHPDVLQDARAHTNEKNLRDFTVIFLFTLNDKELAQRVMKQRSEKFKQIGSFNVQENFKRIITIGSGGDPSWTNFVNDFNESTISPLGVIPVRGEAINY